MCLINQIPVICDMGVESLKIEGRLKTEYYLATVIRTYRQAIDDYYTLKEQGRENEYNSDKYMKELLKVKTRGFSEFYFSDTNNQEIHDLDGKSDNLDYEYGAKVISKYDKIENTYIVEIKNKLSINDTLDLLYPNTLKCDTFKIENLYDEKTDEKINTINPGKKGQLVKIKIPFENIESGMIIRRHK